MVFFLNVSLQKPHKVPSVGSVDGLCDLCVPFDIVSDLSDLLDVVRMDSLDVLEEVQQALKGIVLPLSIFLRSRGTHRVKRLYKDLAIS